MSCVCGAKDFSAYFYRLSVFPPCVASFRSGRRAAVHMKQTHIQGDTSGETAVHLAAWEGTDSRGAPAPPGEYEVHAEMLTKPGLTTGKVGFLLGSR